MSYNTHDMHSTKINNQSSDQGITRCNKAWEYIKTRHIFMELSK